ncbi:MAG: hypothetical protein DKM50_04195 [Candidatus Margulisiibacteriota bacterium]|nr:MAG: hypothetical protein A2X43_11380 [Candidatus Margulisbacteria bacterium GWD2_39_127]OGI05459.1 MAG: hypothetical protein A2X42_12625 [Candidatus Margulisbacteria bacterium GWF2_38_17]OGI06836.1 MAG: hypothetical protein A2X41_12600 [Candidatus Margulisbacteria bacterium GWE2_39_32]PZM82164.1 MAG: hypothetical protein DKM50_04195 [Candidatus Margulisiibacteriota bacterium]HAR64431.1 hypothetical protein [Candidatus Margulisiibacteriota bacterium]
MSFKISDFNPVNIYHNITGSGQNKGISASNGYGSDSAAISQEAKSQSAPKEDKGWSLSGCADSIGKFYSGAKKVVVNGVEKAKDVIMSAPENLYNAFVGMVDMGKSFFGGIVKTGKSLFERVIDTAKSVIGGAVNFVTELFSAAKSTVASYVAQSVRSMLAEVMQSGSDNPSKLGTKGSSGSSAASLKKEFDNIFTDYNRFVNDRPELTEMRNNDKRNKTLEYINKGILSDNEEKAKGSLLAKLCAFEKKIPEGEKGDPYRDQVKNLRDIIYTRSITLADKLSKVNSNVA